jgi:hypothetical protein
MRSRQVCPISPEQARVTSLHIIITYCILIINEVVDIHHLKLHHLTLHHTPSPNSSSSLLLLTPPPHSSSSLLLLITPPHSSSEIRPERPLYYYCYCSSLWSNTSFSNLLSRFSNLSRISQHEHRDIYKKVRPHHPDSKGKCTLSLKLHFYYLDALLAFKCMNNCAPIYLSSQLITCRGEMSSRETRNVIYLEVPI